MNKGSIILKQDTRGRVRTPVERRKALVAEFERSGLSAMRFVALAGVRYNTFWNWLKNRGVQPRRSRSKAGQRSAILYTIIEACRRRGIDPWTYLRDVLTRLPTLTNWHVKDVTPEAWAKARSHDKRIAA